MAPSSRPTVWLCRIVLTVVTILFTMISWHFMSDPVGMAPEFGLAATSSLGATTLRIGMGAFPMTLALITLSCLLTSRFVTGLSIVAILMGLILGVRTYAGLTGSIMAEHTFILYAEGVMLTLALLGLYLENKRQRAGNL